MSPRMLATVPRFWSIIASASCVANGLRGLSRLRVHRFRAVEIPAGLMDYRDDIERVRDRGFRARLGRGGNCCFENIDRGAAIPLLQIRSSQPAKRAKSRLIIGKRVAHERLVPGRCITPTALALRSLCLVYECTDLHRFHFALARSGTPAHDEARIVRREEPSSRSFLVSVGREIPRMRAAALRFPPVSPIVV